ncbi:MAG TPA: putative toxin-antitoxin system toxin component, PIN family [Blastocatellia bacterium]|nr:putative toxin-antitoxin system toxin component, PIN family [Blastocatellia bacterium]HMX28475.1 putative toxin-antitoxin system toxin component, PIN family [Blastocatellia bacterium]HMZ22259.1 putative toxin-antitoxin system toxin component, PIN family [Blastocatellia bacterium]HNG32855.1 putative toxin-antitoxin system toxin component, PIN family [Blastocatellia bacterium]
MEKPRVVFDCMVYLQAVVRETSCAAACLRLAETHQVNLFISRKIIFEVQDVLSRNEIRTRFKTITDQRAAEFIDCVRRAASLVKTIPQHFDYQERDVKDEPYINLAIEVQADYLVSRDNDLLDLMNWNQEAGREFQKRFRFLKIVTPEVFLVEIGKTTSAP